MENIQMFVLHSLQLCYMFEDFCNYKIEELFKG